MQTPDDRTLPDDFILPLMEDGSAASLCRPLDADQIRVVRVALVSLISAADGGVGACVEYGATTREQGVVFVNDVTSAMLTMWVEVARRCGLVPDTQAAQVARDVFAIAAELCAPDGGSKVYPGIYAVQKAVRSLCRNVVADRLTKKETQRKKGASPCRPH